jgi:ethanolamine utilization microcompartment shell protein EutS
VIVCGLISFGGLWAWRLWGNIMAIISSVLATGTAFFELFDRFAGRFVLTNTTDVIETVIKTILSIGVIVLVSLPGSKPTDELEA